ncbi:MAG: hypothetical protein WCD81_05475 [Candidatus Bathyarchaeia archaeon]
MPFDIETTPTTPILTAVLVSHRPMTDELVNPTITVTIIYKLLILFIVKLFIIRKIHIGQGLTVSH